MTRSRRTVPWWLRLIGKVLLSPVPYRYWQRASLFRHGPMEDGKYVAGVFEKHCRFAGDLPPGSVILEVGPGDSVGSALLARGIGAAHVYLIDSAAFANTDPELYRTMARQLTNAGYDMPKFPEMPTFADVLSACTATYLTDGVRSLATLPTASVDFAWSNSVLQHISRAQMPAFAAELHRVLRPDGVSSHTIDFTDMLGGSLNHLRVPTFLWESILIDRSLAYTNRLRWSEMLDCFREAGFWAQVIHQERWVRIPVARKKMRPQFREQSNDDLLTYQIDVVLRPKQLPVR